MLPTINQTNSKRGQITYRLEIVVSTSYGIVVVMPARRNFAKALRNEGEGGEFGLKACKDTI